ncbi:putative phosphoglycerate mutase [Haloactinospora alba]|uniref:Putative phosphoglycerate mutase n=1 Tax=Haloactinospora alba TaxID=405555 RepID=A0A543NHV5_9ACTN|nr:bifunctional RNase H/acid phosphatase [Haloactinospora alba]TQN31436.1 putative phosphoglycerate mutase [Haloactinospora alba]
MARCLVLEADGGSRGNPGPAGYGAVVRDATTGEVVAEVAESLGSATNNVAEYHGLIAGLEAAAGIDPQAAVDARLDSKLVVEQMCGRWRVKHPDMRPLAQRAKERAAALREVTYTWVPRSQNTHADRLANEAMDAAASGAEMEHRRSASTTVSEPEPSHESSAEQPPPDTTPTRLLLLRHGETPLSAEGRFSDSGESALTETGRAQAGAAASALAREGIDAILSSPLRRSRETAERVAREIAVDVEFRDELTETDFGEWAGMSFSEARKHSRAELDRWLADPEVAPPGGESFAAVARRVSDGRDKILAQHRAGTVLLVSHATPITVMVQQALLAPLQALYRMRVDTACLTEIDCYSDGPMVLRRFNDAAHLGGTG